MFTNASHLTKRTAFARHAAALVATVVAAAAFSPLASAAPPTNRAGHCLTPVASDGNEPPCNPHVASPAWSTNHRNSYAQGSSPYPGPHPGDDVVWQDITFPNELPVILQFSEPYPDGGRTVWFSTVAVPQYQVYKLDYETGEVLGNAPVPRDGPPRLTTSGVYNLLDRDNHLITPTEQGLAVYGDEQPGLRTSDIELLHDFRLPARALCRPDDRIIGMTMTYTGEVAFATVQGMVGTVPREPERMTEENLEVGSINGERCPDPSVATSELEEVGNSISADEDGGIYIVSTEAQYRFDLDRSGIDRTWRSEYESGGGSGGSTITPGSGSTPDVVGTEPGEDKFVVITDGQEQAHLVLFWRDKIPPGWKPVAPGRDRRIACEHPVTFGDPNTTEAKSEQSVLTRGYSSVIVNNVLRLDEAFAAAPPPYNSFSQFLGNVPGNAPQGIERIDWDPKARTCESVWGNPDVSIPNSVPTMSTESGLVYGTGVENGFWGLSGIDFETGEEGLFVPTTPSPTENSYYAATTVGPDGDIWNGGTTGISVFRGPERPEPKLACKDLEGPRSRAATRRGGGQRIAVGSRARGLSGGARDKACGLRANRNVKRVRVAVVKKVRGGCRHLAAGGRLGPRKACSKRRFLRAELRERAGGMRKRAVGWSLRAAHELAQGHYRVVSRARDRSGNVESRKAQRVQKLRVRAP